MKDKNNEKTWIGQNLTLVVIILVTTLIAILFLFNGQNSSPNLISDQSISVRNNINISNITDISNGTNVTDKDKDFKNWFSLSFMLIYNDLDCISKAGKNQNFSDTELCGKLLKENSNRSLEQISRHNVSITLQTVLEEYKKSLEYYNVGGINLEIGARNRNMTQIIEATKYIRNGTDNMYIVADILDNISYKNDTKNITTSVQDKFYKK